MGTLVLLGLFTIVAGYGVVGRWAGVLIDERNRFALSRLQMLLWTIVVLSAFLTAALSNVAVMATTPAVCRAAWAPTTTIQSTNATPQSQAPAPGSDTEPAVPGPLEIAIPSELWVAMGITTTALIGSPLINNMLANRPAGQNDAQGAPASVAGASVLSERSAELAAQRGIPLDSVCAQGQLACWRSLKDASFADLFRGEVIPNFAHLDLGKVQMFYFTLVLLVAYSVAIGTRFAGSQSACISSLPAFDSGMAALLAISNGAFLINKAIPRS